MFFEEEAAFVPGAFIITFLQIVHSGFSFSFQMSLAFFQACFSLPSLYLSWSVLVHKTAFPILFLVVLAIFDAAFSI